MVIAHWSKSSLSTLLENCSWQWALNKLGGYPSPGNPASLLGTAVHAALEIHETARIGGGEATLAELQAEAWDRIMGHEEQLLTVVPWSENEQRELAETSGNVIKGWWESDARQHLLTYTPIYTEAEFLVPVQGSARMLKGFIDWFGVDADGRFVTIDWKTAGAWRRWDTEEKHLIERAAYLYGATKAGWFPEGRELRVEWHVMNSKTGDTRILQGRPAEAHDYAELERMVHAADAILDAQYFPTKVDSPLCSAKWCAMYQGCQVDGTLHPRNLQLAGSAAGEAPGVEVVPPLAASPGSSFTTEEEIDGV